MPVISPESVAKSNTSCYTCIGGPTVEMGNYLRLAFNPTGQSPYTVDVHVGKSYTIQYYDACKQSYQTVTGTVSGISTEALALYTVTVIDENGNLCLCSKRDNLSGYIGTETYHIPLINIAKIQEYSETPVKPTPTERSETFVQVLGISSRVIHAVIVHLTIYNDDVQHTCTSVDMEVGRIYKVTYCREKDHTVFEVTGRLIQIKELPQFGNESPESGYVRPDYNEEQVGMYGNTYDPRYFHALPKYNPDGDRIQFVFDTSKDFQRLYDTVMLKEIRNVIDITPCPPPAPGPMPPWYGPDNPPPPPMPPITPPPCPGPCPCPPPMNPFPGGPNDWPPCQGPSDMPPGWTPGDDPVDPGFNNPSEPPIWTPTNPMPGTGDTTKTGTSSDIGSIKVDPGFYL